MFTSRSEGVCGRKEALPIIKETYVNFTTKKIILKCHSLFCVLFLRKSNVFDHPNWTKNYNVYSDLISAKWKKKV